jgi:hypothetical protein
MMKRPSWQPFNTTSRDASISTPSLARCHTMSSSRRPAWASEGPYCDAVVSSFPSSEADAPSLNRTSMRSNTNVSGFGYPPPSEIIPGSFMNF